MDYTARIQQLRLETDEQRFMQDRVELQQKIRHESIRAAIDILQTQQMIIFFSGLQGLYIGGSAKRNGPELPGPSH